MLHGKREVHNEVTTVYLELHQQLAKGHRKLYTIMQGIRDVVFAGMQKNINDLHENISVGKIGMVLPKQWNLICLLKW